MTLDPILCDLVVAKGEYLETLEWNELFERCRARLTSVTSVSVNGKAPVIKKGKMEQIVLNVQLRAGNKKVCRFSVRPGIQCGDFFLCSIHDRFLLFLYDHHTIHLYS